MSAFDKVIGYETIKRELLQICDMIHNRSIYEALGAKLPRGILIFGDPGLGKTLMANCFIEESGLNAFTIRRNRGNDDFIAVITETFAKAKENAPSIVFLDDMDKFANEDNNHRNAEEYVAVQSGIDEVKNSDVFVLATANELEVLPRSLIRSGRFDRRIEVMCPTDKDAASIISHYLANKKVSDSVDWDDLTKMFSYSSCAELETIINDAAIGAASQRKDCIEMEDIIQSVLRRQYSAPDNYSISSEEDMRRIAYHEAGHIVVCEAVLPGSVGLASLRSNGRGSIGGFIHRCKDLKKPSFDVLVSLAGKAATDLYYADTSTDGCITDIARASQLIGDSVYESGVLGLGFVDVSTDKPYSQDMLSHCQTAIRAELERYMTMAKAILIKNREFLEQTADALVMKHTLLHSDICEIKNRVHFVEATL